MKQKTALMELITMLENNEPVFPDTKKKLLELEREQLLSAYSLDPDLMRIVHKKPIDWYLSNYGS